MIGTEFQMAEGMGRNVYVHGQIVDARGFDTKHMFVKTQIPIQTRLNKQEFFF